MQYRHRRRTLLTTSAKALSPLVTGSVLAVFGCILLVAGLADVARSPLPPRSAWTQAWGVERNGLVGADRTALWLSIATCCLGIEPLAIVRQASALLPDVRHLPADTPQPAAELFSDDGHELRLASQQSSSPFGGDEQGPDPNVPPEGWDVRWGLMEMAGAQRGHWTRQCPCPYVAAAR